MLKIGLARERPSRVSLALIACFSVGLIAMAGWLGVNIVFSGNADTAAAPNELTATAPPRVENATPAYVPPLMVATPATQGEAPPGNSRSDPGMLTSGGAPAQSTTYTTSALAVPNTAIRGPGDLLPVQPEPAASEPMEMVPLPVPRPRRVASIPVPRPRPLVDEAPPPPPRERSFFDILLNR